MLVWVASFPRSGNTYLRILLKHMYGIGTSTVYDIDAVAERLGRDFVGYVDRPAALDEMRDSDELHFVKTHSARHAAMSDHDRALCIVRDGRDALVSWARLRIAATGGDFSEELRRLIEEPRDRGPAFWDSGSWGTNVLSWSSPTAGRSHMMLFDELIEDPTAVLQEAMRTVAPELSATDGIHIPTFEDLQRVDAGFFRRGQVGAHLTELPDDLEAAFWSRDENRLAMAELSRL